MKQMKTNVMRILEQNKIPYAAHPYGISQLDAVHAPDALLSLVGARYSTGLTE